MKLHLEGKEGNWSLEEGDYDIGRSAKCAVRLRDPRVSRRHAILHVGPGGVTIEELGSSNGVLVNGDRITGSARLGDQDSLVAGPCLFRVRIEGADVDLDHDTTESTEGAVGKKQSRTSLEFKPSTDLVGAAKPQAEPPSDFEPGTNEPQKPGTDSRHPGTDAALTDRHSEDDRRNRDPLTGEKIDRGRISDEHLPSDHRRVESVALQRRDWFGEGNEPVQVTSSVIYAADVRPPSSRRLIAAVCLDGLQTVLTALLLGLAATAVGILLAQNRHVGGSDLIPPWGERLAALFTADGIAAAGTEISRWHAEGSAPFTYFFVAATIGAVAMVLTFLLDLVIPTMLRGAPLWHRVFKLEIIDTGTKSYLAAGKAVARSLLFLLMLPLAPIAIAMGRTTPYDAIVGAEVVQH